MRDIYFSIGVWAFFGGAALIYLARSLLLGRKRHARTQSHGGSRLLHESIMEMPYWLFGPAIEAMIALRITPNMLTAFSLVPALGAGIAIAFGWFGLAAVLATTAAISDLLDGVLARKTGVASDAGEVIDAGVDRYVEGFFLAGVTIYYRSHWMVMLLSLAALQGSFMVSYSTSKAEAMGIPPPRGSMRRAERAVYLLVAASLTSISKVVFADAPSHALRELPIIVALTMVGVVSNVSAVQRFASMAQILRARRPAPPPVEPDATALIVKPEGAPTGLV